MAAELYDLFLDGWYARVRVGKRRTRVPVLVTCDKAQGPSGRGGGCTGGRYKVSGASTMWRDACGYHLTNNGQDTRAIQQYLEHKNIQHSVRYTELTSDWFRDFWKD